MPANDVKMPSLAEILERVRARRRQERGSVDLQNPGTGQQMPARDAPQSDDPYISQAMAQRPTMEQREMVKEYARREGQNVVSDVDGILGEPELGEPSMQSRTFAPSGPPQQQAMPQSYPPSQPQAQAMPRSYPPSGPPQQGGPEVAQVSSAEIRQRVADGSMDPRLARMLLAQRGEM